MLTHPTLEKLQALRLAGMARAFEDQQRLPEIDSLSFEERLGLLVDREMTEGENRRMKTRLHQARLRQQAALEDVDFRHPRGLDKSLIAQLSSCHWIAQHHNILITGPTGCGKTFLACALAHKACREGYTVRYLRLPRLFQDLQIAKGDGRYPKLLAALAKTDLIALDDWGIPPWPTNSAGTSWNSSKIVTVSVPLSWPRNSRWINGTPRSGIPPWPMPSWIA